MNKRDIRFQIFLLFDIQIKFSIKSRPDSEHLRIDDRQRIVSIPRKKMLSAENRRDAHVTKE